KLRGAPLLERRMPARCHQALRSRYRARIPSAEGQIVAELTVLVGDHEHVIVGHVLAEERNLLLDLLVPAIRATVSRIKVEAALLPDLAAEAFAAAPDRLGKSLIAGLGSNHQKPAAPALPHKVLGEGIREHVARRRRMDDVASTVCSPQLVIAGPRIHD